MKSGKVYIITNKKGKQKYLSYELVHFTMNAEILVTTLTIQILVLSTNVQRLCTTQHISKPIVPSELYYKTVNGSKLATNVTPL